MYEIWRSRLNATFRPLKIVQTIMADHPRPARRPVRALESTWSSEVAPEAIQSADEEAQPQASSTDDSGLTEIVGQLGQLEGLSEQRGEPDGAEETDSFEAAGEETQDQTGGSDLQSVAQEAEATNLLEDLD